MRGNRMTRLALAALVALVGVAIVPAVGTAADVTYNWYAEHKNAEAIGYDITTLFLALQQRGLLPLDQYEDREGKFVVDIMRA